MQPKKRSFLPFFLTVFIDLLGAGIVIPILAPLFLNPHSVLFSNSASLTLRSVLLGVLIGAYSFAQFFGAPILGGLSDRLGRRKILIISLIGNLTGYLFFTFGLIIGNLWFLFISRLVSGFMGGNISAVLSATADISNEKTKAKNFGYIGVAYALGFILGPSIGGKLANPSIVSWFNYTTPFWFSSMLVLLNIIMVIWLFPETLFTKIKTKISLFTGIHNIRKAFLLPNLKTIFIVMFLLTFVFSFFIQYFQVHLVEIYRFNQSQIGDLFAYIGLWATISQGIILGLLVKKYSERSIISSSLLILTLSLFALFLTHTSSALFIILPFMAIAYGLLQPMITTVVSNLSSKNSQGEIIGINQSIQSLGQAIPPVIAGYIVSLHLYLPILISVIITFTAWLIFILNFGKKKEQLFVEE